ncbi:MULTISPECIES: hypothetical protein [unclassified Helicobacter]|nr:MULTISPECIES: hypothetical protein [unclassified Helicobacter]
MYFARLLASLKHKVKQANPPKQKIKNKNPNTKNLESRPQNPKLQNLKP